MLPTGEIVAHPARGTLMGNRGILHDPEGRLGRARWRHPHWIACRLDFRGRRREVMAPASYTELFFLDEVVSLAAGHRPCAECRGEDYRRFRDAWGAAFGERPRAADLDRRLHAERLAGRPRRQASFRTLPDGLPDGTFVCVGGAPHLILDRHLLAFSPAGYGVPVGMPDEAIDVLTPAPTVAVLRAGYRGAVHPSASV